MDPEYHQGRRHARAEERNAPMANVICTHAAEYRTRRRYTAVVTDNHALITSALIHNAQRSDKAEELAVALTIATTEAETVITDLPSAY